MPTAAHLTRCCVFPVPGLLAAVAQAALPYPGLGWEAKLSLSNILFCCPSFWSVLTIKLSL